jgi:hypothetical protein
MISALFILEGQLKPTRFMILKRQFLSVGIYSVSRLNKVQINSTTNIFWECGYQRNQNAKKFVCYNLSYHYGKILTIKLPKHYLFDNCDYTFLMRMVGNKHTLPTLHRRIGSLRTDERQIGGIETANGVEAVKIELCD